MRVFVAVIVCAYFILVKGSPANTANNDIAVTPTATTALPVNTPAESYLKITPPPTGDVNAELTTVPPLPLPPLFGNILSTLAERLNATMELPLLQGERDRIMQSTLAGLKRCKEQFRSTNIQLRYRVCVDKQVQGALNKARAVELRVFRPADWDMGEGGRMLPIPGEVQHRQILEISKKIPGSDLV